MQVMATTNITRRPPNFKFDREIKIPGACISSIAITQDHILMCNYNGQEVLIYDKDFKRQNVCDLSGKPWDNALIPDSEFAVVTFPWQKSIQFIHLSKMKAGKTILVPNHAKIQSITASADKLFLGGVGEIVVTDLECNLITIFKPIGSGNFTVYYMHIDSNKNVFCSVLGDKIVTCIDVDGKSVFKCKNEAFQHLEGITTNDQGNVYVADSGNHCIHVLTSDGTYKGEALQECTFEYTWAVCYEKKSRRLYISYNNGEIVSVFNLL